MNELTQLIELIWATLVRASVYATIAFPIAWIACFFLRRFPRRLHCWIWRIAYAKVVVASVCFYQIEIPILPATNSASVLIAEQMETSNLSNNENPRPANESVQSTPVTHSFHIIHLATFAWFIAMVCLQFRFLRKWSETIRIRRDAEQCNSGHVYERYLQSAQALDCQNPPPLLLSRSIDVPALVGFISPAVVIPHGFPYKVHASELGMVFRHELGHFKRNDLAWNLLPWIVNCFLYFHPLNWLANRRWSACQEAACDELVLQSPDTDSKSYAGTLIRVAELMRHRQNIQFSTIGAVSSFSALRERILAMQHVSRMSRSNVAMAAVGLLTIAAVAIIPWRPVPHSTHPIFINGGFETGDTSGWTITPGPNATFAFDNVQSFDIDDDGPRGLSNAFALSVGQSSYEKDVYRHVDITQNLYLESGQGYELSFDWAVKNFYSIDNFDGGVFELIVDGRVLSSFDTKNVFTKSTETGSLSSTYTAARTGLHSIGVRIARRFPVPFPNASKPIQLQYVDNFLIERRSQ